MIFPEAIHKQDYQERWSGPWVEKAILDGGLGLPIRYRCISDLVVETETPVVTSTVAVLGKLELDRLLRVF